MVVDQGQEVHNDPPRRKQRGILMDHGSILRRKRRGIEPEEIKRMSPISLSDSLNYLMKHTKA